MERLEYRAAIFQGIRLAGARNAFDVLHICNTIYSTKERATFPRDEPGQEKIVRSARV